MSAGLNLAQLQAVHYTEGPCLVLAGAGSGKTRVITHKIGRLIETGLAPRRIAAITFTNKAAAEMRERAAGLIGRQAKEVLICTFHSLGVRMVREDGHILGLKPQFSILDTDDVTGILKDCAGGTTDVATARQWQWTISGWKNQGWDSRKALAMAQDDNERSTALIMQRYEERLTAYQSVDFDDLIGMPMRLLRGHPEVRENGNACWAMCWWTNIRTPMPRSTSCSNSWWASAPTSRPWETTISRSTAGAAPRWTTSGSCPWTFRSSRSSSWSRTTAPPAPSCAPPTM